MTAPTVGPYRVISSLGRGGMGEVYLAEDTRLGRRVALKTLSDPTLASPEAHARPRGEARAAAALTHPNVAAIYDVLEADGQTHIVMEYVEGETLAARVARGPAPEDNIRSIGGQLCAALTAAHRRGVIHRDLKPSNVIVTPDGTVKVLDFGIARHHADDAAAGWPAGTSGSTLTGPFLGTPGYSAPEQLLGRRANERSDVYSLR